MQAKPGLPVFVACSVSVCIVLTLYVFVHVLCSHKLIWHGLWRAYMFTGVSTIVYVALCMRIPVTWLVIEIALSPSST